MDVSTYQGLTRAFQALPLPEDDNLCTALLARLEAAEQRLARRRDGVSLRRWRWESSRRVQAYLRRRTVLPMALAPDRRPTGQRAIDARGTGLG